jgi:hypothetical protein
LGRRQISTCDDFILEVDFFFRFASLITSSSAGSNVLRVDAADRFDDGKSLESTLASLSLGFFSLFRHCKAWLDVDI